MKLITHTINSWDEDFGRLWRNYAAMEGMDFSGSLCTSSG